MNLENQEDNLEYLLQYDVINNLTKNIGEGGWQKLYFSDYNKPNRFDIFSALLEPQYVKKALERDDWDLQVGDGLPGLATFGKEEKDKTIYLRFGTVGVRPLVIYRDFKGAWPSYLELSEEFRHFHNLAEDSENYTLLDFDESGNKIEVVKITENEVKVHWPYLIKFLAATQLHLAIYFDSVRYSKIPFDDIPEKDRQLEYQDETTKYSMYVAKPITDSDYPTYSRLLGKVVIAPPSIEKCGKWPFEKEKKYESFIVGIDFNGENKELISNPEKLYDSNLKKSLYSTPVYFKKEVLEKYYTKPEQYLVEDSYIKCFDLWSLKIDKTHPTHVIAFIGDIGRDLPYIEQLHWKSHNVPPPADAKKISETFLWRSFLLFAEPVSIDSIFRQEYQKLNNVWNKKMGWPLFIDLHPKDKYIQSIHIPSILSQKATDEQISYLTKLLVDALNKAELDKALKNADKALENTLKNKGSIDSFDSFIDHFFTDKGFKYKEEIIEFLRDLQRLRSKSTAHLKKEKEYAKILQKLGLVGKNGADMIKILIEEATEALKYLDEFLN